MCDIGHNRHLSDVEAIYSLSDISFRQDDKHLLCISAKQLCYSWLHMYLVLEFEVSMLPPP